MRKGTGTGPEFYRGAEAQLTDPACQIGFIRVHANSTSASDDTAAAAISGASPMASHKRKRSVSDDDDLDIAPALTFTGSRAMDTDDEQLDEFIHDAIVKRDVKGGTHMLRKIKGKGNGKGDVGGGSFQSMGRYSTPSSTPPRSRTPGLHPHLLRALTLQGYRTPTPIQRATLPSLLASPPRDLVGMARTGSGKTLAYMIPLVQRLGGRHVHAFGARAIILVPARELALQVVKVGKSLAKGWKGEAVSHAGDGHDVDDDNSKMGSGESLRWGLIVGGEGMDEQFEMISGNPDVSVNRFCTSYPVLTFTRIKHHCNSRPPSPPHRRDVPLACFSSICRLR